MWDAMHTHRNLDVAWIDYRKAFDHVPHGWLRELLELCRVPLKIQQCLSDLQTKWRTVFSLKHAGGELTTQEVQYRRGLFQGDALSPLLFCLSITPLSYGLQNTTGYPARFLTNSATHLMFVDDLKIYALGAKALGQSLKVVERITTSIGMRIGAQKCATACLRKGKRTEASDYSITEDVIKVLVDGQTYNTSASIKPSGWIQKRSDVLWGKSTSAGSTKSGEHRCLEGTKSMQPISGQYLSSGTISVVHSSGPRSVSRGGGVITTALIFLAESAIIGDNYC